jgi:general stress protein 26
MWQGFICVLLKQTNMDHIKNLHDEEAVKKIKELAMNTRVCMFCTQLDKKPFETRPMNTMDVDDDGNLWFFSSKHSDKDREIRQDEDVQLLYSDIKSSAYMTVFGQADVFYDREKVEELWVPIVKAWFEEGKDDERLEIIRVRPKQAYYWDTKHGKMVAFIKILAATITGKPMDDSIEGTAKV